MAEEERDRWHLITTATVAVAAIMYINKIDQRVTVVEVQVASQRESSVVLRAQLEKINDKLDRLIERTK